MESKSLRKSLRIWSEGLSKAQLELEALNTKENQELMIRYPIVDSDWRHPQSHILERTIYFTEQARKCALKMVSALPPERKTKVVKFVEAKASKEKSLNEQAKPTPKKPKKKAGGFKLSDSASKDNRKADNQTRKPRGGAQSPPIGVGIAVRKPRKTRSDKGTSKS